MADWSLSYCERQEAFTANISRGAANVKGSFVQVAAASSFQYSALSFQLYPQGGGGQCYLVDIAIGAGGSEVVIVPNILLDSARGTGQNMLNITLPIAVAAGTRIAARIQEPGGAGTRDVQIQVVGRAGGSNYAQPDSGLAINYGAITATTNGALIDPGAVSNTYGAWTEMTSATSMAHNGITAVMGLNQQTGNLVDSAYYFQIAIGASGSEIVIVEWMSSLSAGFNRFGVNSFDINAAIPVGTRIAMRSKCVASALAAARNPTAIILGY